jgi:dihydrofolate synthase / folylpolyglutamate synthase
MEIIPIKTSILRPPQDDLLTKIKKSRLQLREGDVVALTSKVVSIWQGRCVPQEGTDKHALAKKEADYYAMRRTAGGNFLLTIKNNVLIASAGIDASNADGYYILWPRNLKKTAEELLRWFKKTYRKKQLGLIITDSHMVPFRRGVVGVAISWAGFEPLHDYRKTKDIFGRKFRVSQVNIPDALATAAVYAMGEGREQTPLAVIRKAPHIRPPRKRHGKYESFNIPFKEDLFAPFLKSVRWRRRKH